ncbi:hypothetical protein Xgly_21255 [Xanthomonas citri pv. glycines]|uniref:Uncharacterized protein n=1 Tax=Xanthomonas campestris pv. glycines TaxID=473421 RepID=A0AAX0I549_XANCG|nr:hypothetical protein BIY41_09935 [Xanthomonas citri pv. glycines]OOW99305.1 hypothetical protein Xgly_21255 [Xanthomonas citri pv. glycines]
MRWYQRAFHLIQRHIGVARTVTPDAREDICASWTDTQYLPFAPVDVLADDGVVPVHSGRQTRQRQAFGSNDAGLFGALERSTVGGS